MLQTILRSKEQLSRVLFLVLGFTLAILLVSYRTSQPSPLVLESELLRRLDDMQRRLPPAPVAGHDSLRLNEPLPPAPDVKSKSPIDELPMPVEGERMSDDEIAERIKAIRENSLAITNELRLTRLLCMVLGRPNGDDRIKAVIRTWGKRCTKIVFLLGGSELQVAHLSPDISIVSLPLEDKWDNTWWKVRQGVKYIHRAHKGEFDWFMRIDDDAYVIMENLIMFLRTRDPTKPEFYGVNYKTFDGYVGTGAGLTLSAHNFELLVKSLDHEQCMKEPTHNDDVEISKCMRLLGLRVADSRDSLGRARYFPLDVAGTLDQRLWPDWLFNYIAFDLKKGMECCSDSFIGFHYISPEQMIALEFVIYAAAPYSNREIWNGLALPELPASPIPTQSATVAESKSSSRPRSGVFAQMQSENQIQSQGTPRPGINVNNDTIEVITPA